MLTKIDKQYVCVVMYFVDLQKYKLPAAHYHHFYPKNIFLKIRSSQGNCRSCFTGKI